MFRERVLGIIQMIQNDSDRWMIQHKFRNFFQGGFVLLDHICDIFALGLMIQKEQA